MRQSECASRYGNPFAATWASKHITKVKCPWPIYMGTLHVPFIQINVDAVQSLEAVLAHVWDVCGKDLDKIAAIHADQFSGSYVPRQARDSHMISMHAYGLAVDWDAPHNQFKSKEHFFTRKNPLIAAFLDAGWTWGGDWPTRTDAMHVQLPKVD